MNASVCVVIVTYNRKELLIPELEAIAKQTHPVKGIVIVNNNSTDETEKELMNNGIIKEAQSAQIYISEWKGIKIHYCRNPENAGGAGGFAKAFMIAKELTYDYIWAMDDDVLPDHDCLEQLLSEMNNGVRVCIPSRQDENYDDKVILKYNLNNPFLVRLSSIKKSKFNKAIEGTGCFVEDMPLEGPLFDVDIIRKTGGPDASYFIMYDDTDLAHRIGKYSKIRYVKAAHLHRVLASKNSSVIDWNWKDYYMLRNQFVFDQRYGENVFVRRFRPWFGKYVRIASAFVKDKRNRIPLIQRAYRDAVDGNLGKTVMPGTPLEDIK